MPQSQVIPLVAVTPIAFADIAALPVVDIGGPGGHHRQWKTVILLLKDVTSRKCEEESKGVLSYTDATIFNSAHPVQE
jgi:hypothetical protein